MKKKLLILLGIAIAVGIAFVFSRPAAIAPNGESPLPTATR